MGSSVRRRALVHMQALLATSAGVEACHPKSQGSDAGTDAVAFGPPKAPDASVDTVTTVTDVPDANTTTTGRDHGYMVVDPVPRPVFCANVSQRIKAKAVRAGKNVVVTLPAPPAAPGPSFKYTVGQAPRVYGATLVDHKISAGSAVITVLPAGETPFTLGVAGACGSSGLVTISATIAGNLGVTLTDY